jgi:DNA repair protein RadA/Sms
MSQPIRSETQNEILVEAESVDGVPQKKIEFIHVCDECESISDHFRCRCPKCGAYNTLVARDKSTVPMKPVRVAVPVWNSPDADRMPAQPVVGGAPGAFGMAPGGSLMTLGQLENMTGNGRMSTGEPSLDFVLGGGMVAPSVILIGGEPGVGKSTILTQIFGHVGLTHRAYYSAGEEAPEAIAMRVKRVANITDANRANCQMRRGSSFMQVMRDLNEHKPKLVIFDSLQAHLHERVDPTGERQKRGSAAQMTPMAKELHTWAHTHGAVVWLVCHVTKDGDFAGPKTVDHDVDANLMLIKMDNGQIAAASEKNRFGDTNVVGLFTMEENGLKSAS